MNQLVNYSQQLPDNLPDLSRFVLIGREKLNAVRAEIRAIEKVGLAQEVHQQKLQEAQEIAEAVLDAEVQIGKLTAELPKAAGRPSEIIDNGVENKKPKSEALREVGIQQKQAERFQRIAKYPEAVEKAKEEARQEGRIVTRQNVLDEIQKPHVTNNSGDNEWYTPSEYIEAAREVMGSIDLDPASNDFANQTVKAATYYTAETNGLNKEWYGNIWLNPPYSSTLIKQFAEKLSKSNFEQAVILVNNATETGWFLQMIKKASAVVFPTGRIRFEKADRVGNAPLQGQAFIYCGQNSEYFLEVFEQYGWGALL